MSALDVFELFERYRADRRRLELDGFRVDRLQHLTRYTSIEAGMEGHIAFTQLSAGDESAQIDEQIAYFRALRQDFEWTVYELDRPGDLQQLLQARGFSAGEAETFMLYRLHRAGSSLSQPSPSSPSPSPSQPSPLPPSTSPSTSLSAGMRTPWEIRRIDDADGVQDVMAVQQQVWNMDLGWVGTRLLYRLEADPAGLAIYCAYADDIPIGSGWIDFPSPSEFAELHGGAVAGAWRGRGLYAALYRQRLAEARRRAYRYIAVDATALSCPILHKLGFEQVCMAVPMRYRFEDTMRPLSACERQRTV